SLMGMVETCYQSIRYEEGVGYAARCIEVNPWNAAMYAQYADLLRLTGRLAEGIQAAEKGIELNPRFLELRGWLANALRDSGRLSESADQLETIARIRDAMNAARAANE
ncbi:MAG: hypothetical protein HYV60_19615, partial [Planctomycetia bacterium]|nr:hypothetical protein [Planctomycetia bacterium]